MHKNYICQYKALLLQCERDFDQMINVRLYQEMVLLFLRFAAVALTRGGANKMLRKVWEAFFIQRDKIVLREHHKSVGNQNKFDAQLKVAQQSAGQQIDSRVDKSLACLDAKVKSIIKETVKSQSVKKEATNFDHHFWNANFFLRMLTFNSFLNHLLHPSLQKETDNRR